MREEMRTLAEQTRKDVQRDIGPAQEATWRALQMVKVAQEAHAPRAPRHPRPPGDPDGQSYSLGRGGKCSTATPSLVRRFGVLLPRTFGDPDALS